MTVNYDVAVHSIVQKAGQVEETGALEITLSFLVTIWTSLGLGGRWVSWFCGNDFGGDNIREEFVEIRSLKRKMLRLFTIGNREESEGNEQSKRMISRDLPARSAQCRAINSTYPQ